MMTYLPNTKERILIVDDQKSIRYLVTQLLVHMGYEVVEASNGREGLEHFNHHSFDLVITDLNMPEIDGLVLASSIKEKSPHTPIVMITGDHLDDMQRDFIDVVMFKPLTLAEIAHTVQTYLPIF